MTGKPIGFPLSRMYELAQGLSVDYQTLAAIQTKLRLLKESIEQRELYRMGTVTDRDKLKNDTERKIVFGAVFQGDARLRSMYDERSRTLEHETIIQAQIKGTEVQLRALEYWIKGVLAIGLLQAPNENEGSQSDRAAEFLTDPTFDPGLQVIDDESSVMDNLKRQHDDPDGERAFARRVAEMARQRSEAIQRGEDPDMLIPQLPQYKEQADAIREKLVFEDDDDILTPEEDSSYVPPLDMPGDQPGAREWRERVRQGAADLKAQGVTPEEMKETLFGPEVE